MLPCRSDNTSPQELGLPTLTHTLTHTTNTNIIHTIALTTTNTISKAMGEDMHCPNSNSHMEPRMGTLMLGNSARQHGDIDDMIMMMN
eukprot:m.167563 g.167563  ORF g.167563 m.167563 type:complete len:88 (-) comp31466_c0_seq1:57-320(-)